MYGTILRDHVFYAPSAVDKVGYALWVCLAFNTKHHITKRTYRMHLLASFERASIYSKAAVAQCAHAAIGFVACARQRHRS
jgi:hypothetical protein